MHYGNGHYFKQSRYVCKTKNNIYVDAYEKPLFVSRQLFTGKQPRLKWDNQDGIIWPREWRFID